MNISKELQELNRRLSQSHEDFITEENAKHGINLAADTVTAYRNGYAIAKLNDILAYILA